MKSCPRPASICAGSWADIDLPRRDQSRHDADSSAWKVLRARRETSGSWESQGEDDRNSWLWWASWKRKVSRQKCCDFGLSLTIAGKLTRLFKIYSGVRKENLSHFIRHDLCHGYFGVTFKNIEICSKIYRSVFLFHFFLHKLFIQSEFQTIFHFCEFRILIP